MEPGLDSCLPDFHSSRQCGKLVLNVTDCHITALQELVHFIESAKYIGQVGEHHDELFIVEMDIEVVFVVSQEYFHLNKQEN